MDQEPIISNPSDVPEAMNQEIMTNSPAAINHNLDYVIENPENQDIVRVNFGSFGANTPNNPGLMSNSNLDTPPRTTRNRSTSQNRSRL